MQVIRARGWRRIPKRLPRMQHPDMLALKYRRALVGQLLRDMRALLNAKLLPELPRIAAEAAQLNGNVHRDAAASPSMKQIIDEVGRELAKKWTNARASKLASDIAGDIAKFHAGQMNRQLYEIAAINVVGGEPWLADFLREFTRSNVELIQSIPKYGLDRLERTLTGRITDGDRWESLRDELLENYDVTESKATLIARDQTGKLYGDLNQLRQRDLGFDWYIWRTMRDNRVRDAHEDRDGRRFRWSDPPPGDEGEGGHPGESIQCRCYSEPDVRALFEAEGIETAGLDF